MSRALFNRHPGIRRRLAREFVCVHAGTDALQWADTAAARWFKEMADQTIRAYGLEAHFEKYQTYQGFYVCSPDGAPYGLALSWEAEEMERVLDAAIEAHRGHRMGASDISQADLMEADPPTTDPSVSVVRVFCRCTPLPDGAPEVNRSVGRDHMWVFPEEVRQILGSTGEPGANVPLPSTLVARLVRYQLLDNVRGMADFFSASEVTQADFSATFLGVDGSRRRYSLQGDFAAEKDFPGDENYRGKLGVEGRLVGEFDIDVDAAKVVRFRAWAEGEAWGANSNTWGQLPGRFPLVIAIVEADDLLTRTLPPVWAPYVDCTPDDGECDDYRTPTLSIHSSE